MNIKSAIIKLEYLNEWRRSDVTMDIPDPTEVGEVIDFAINELKKIDQKNDKMLVRPVTKPSEPLEYSK